MAYDHLTLEEEQTLRNYYRQQYKQAPTTAATWASLAPRIAAHPQKMPWWRSLFVRTPVEGKGYAPRRFALRPVVVALLLLTLVIGTGTTYAAFTGTFESLAQALGFQFGVPAARGGHETVIHQQKTADGVTITVEKASVNDKWIVIGYTYTIANSDDTGKHVRVRDLTVTQRSSSTTLREQVEDTIPVQDGKAGYSNTAYFSTASLAHESGEMKVHLVMVVSEQGHDTTVPFDFTLPAV